MPLASLTWIRTGAGMLRTLEKTRRLHLEEIKSASERQVHEGSGLVFLRRSRVDPARPPAPGVPGLALLPGPSLAVVGRASCRAPGDRVQGGSSISDKRPEEIEVLEFVLAESIRSFENTYE